MIARSRAPAGVAGILASRASNSSAQSPRGADNRSLRFTSAAGFPAANRIQPAKSYKPLSVARRTLMVEGAGALPPGLGL